MAAPYSTIRIGILSAIATVAFLTGLAPLAISTEPDGTLSIHAAPALADDDDEDDRDGRDDADDDDDDDIDDDDG